MFLFFFFFFNDTATTEIYTLSLHDALPISCCSDTGPCCSLALRRSDLLASWLGFVEEEEASWRKLLCSGGDRKSTRLNSSHLVISYAVFCLKKKKKKKIIVHCAYRVCTIYS